MNIHQKNTDKKRMNILKTTRDLILQFGSEKISIREIAKIAGVSQVTIYNHFENKEALIKHTMEILIDEVLLEYDTIIDLDILFEEKLKKIFDIRKAISGQGILFSLTKIAKSDSYIAEKIETDLQRKMKISFLKLIQYGKDEGKINYNTNDNAILTYFQIFKSYYIEPSNAKLFIQDPELVFDIWELFWNGIRS